MRKFAFALLIASCLTPAFANVPLAALSGETPSLAPMVRSVTPAVVSVLVKGTQEAQQHPFFNDPSFRFFFGEPPAEREVRGLGSGVIVDAQKGLILTNHHVIADADEIRVRLTDDREVDAKLVGSDPDSDVAVLEIEADNLTAVPIGNSDTLEVGDFVVAIGNPFGLRQTVTSGIVSALGRSGLGNRYENFIQTDAAINRGNSGGALVNLKGELVGINTAIISNSGGSVGLGFAIPAKLAMSVKEQIVEHGGVKRGMLGVIGQDLTPDLAKAFGLEKARGAVVARVLDDSAADKGGLKPGDIITHVDGNEIRDFDALRNAIGLHREGDAVKLRYLRDGKPKTAKVTLGASRGVDGSSQALHPKLEGARFGEIPDDHPQADLEGVLVVEVEPRGAAARAGLRRGDIVDSVNREPVKSLDELRDELADTADDAQLLLHVQRGNGALFLLVR